MSAPDIDLDGLPNSIDRLSYARIVRGFGGTYAVETWDIEPSGYLRPRERWFGPSEGRAMLVAQLLQARGYNVVNLRRTRYA